MDKLLQELKGRVDQAEVYRLSGRAVPVNFRSGKLESIKSHAIDGVALRVIVDGRLGFATSTDLSDPSGLIAAALDSAKFGEPAGFSFAAETSPVQTDVYDEKAAAIPEEELIELGERAIAAITRADPEANVSVSITREVEAVTILNTSGLELTERRTTISGQIELGKARTGDIFLLFDSAQARFLSEFDMDGLVARLIRHLEYGRDIVTVKTGPMPVVFTPNGAVALLLPLLIGFNGKSVYMGTSPLKGRVGEKAFDARFSLTDDGTIPGGPRSSGFDDEGTETMRTPLAEEGVIAGFIYDRRTAALAGVSPTGNGYKSGLFGGGGFRTPPGPVSSNVIVSPGEVPEEELIAGIEEGLLVESVLGLGQGNLASGEFSNNVAVAFKIENGKIVGRVKNTMIAGNVYEILKDHLIGLGRETEFVHGSLSTPMIAVDQVNVVSG